MRQEVIQAFSANIRHELFRRLGVSGRATDLEGFENFVYLVGDQIVRVTHESHRSVDQLNGELEFLKMLDEKGAPVAAPVQLPDGRYIESVQGYHACLFQKARGVRVHHPIDRNIIEAWGEAIGLFHSLAKGYSSDYPRPDWQDDDNHQFRERIPAEQHLILTIADELMAQLTTLPTDDAVYGMIHSDAHPGNFLVNGDRLTFFDFDDCLFAWFGYDLATLMFGIALLVEEKDRAAEVAGFLETFLNGYQRTNSVDALLLSAMPQLLRLRELSFYGVVHAFMDPDNLVYETARRYMHGRRSRLEQGVPLVELDFQQYA